MSSSYHEIHEPMPEGSDWWRSNGYFPTTILQQDFGYRILDSDLQGPWQKDLAPQRLTDEFFRKSGSSTVLFGRGVTPQSQTDESLLRAGLSGVQIGHESTASQSTADKSSLQTGSFIDLGHEGAAPQATAKASLDETYVIADESQADSSTIEFGHDGKAPQPGKDETPLETGSSKDQSGTFVIICSSHRFQDLEAKVVRDFVVVSGRNRREEKDGSVVISSFTRRYMLPKECWGEKATIRNDKHQLYVEVKMNMSSGKV